MSAWRALLAGLVVVGLGGGLMYALMTDRGAGSSPQPILVGTPPPPAAASVVPATVTIPRAIVTTTPSQGIVTSTVASTPQVVAAMQDALAAWGQFAVTGRMRDLGDYFVVGGPQRRQLRVEAAALQEAPPGPPPYEVTTGEVYSLSVTEDDVVLRAEVFWAREGAATQTFLWDIQMQRIDGVWRLLTVEEAAG